MPNVDSPRCVNCWSPLRRDLNGVWLNDEALSRPYCSLPGRPHEPMNDEERRHWAAFNA